MSRRQVPRLPRRGRRRSRARSGSSSPHPEAVDRGRRLRRRGRTHRPILRSRRERACAPACMRPRPTPASGGAGIPRDPRPSRRTTRRAGRGDGGTALAHMSIAVEGTVGETGPATPSSGCSIRGATTAARSSCSRTSPRRRSERSSIIASGLRKSTNGAAPSNQPTLQPAAKPSFVARATAVRFAPAIVASVSSLEALSTTTTETSWSWTSGATHRIRCSELLKVTMMTSITATMTNGTDVASRGSRGPK